MKRLIMDPYNSNATMFFFLKDVDIILLNGENANLIPKFYNINTPCSCFLPASNLVRGALLNRRVTV